ncbi:hypothetical protein V8C35DRAFT_315437 [Trichoderma chlorosporum]
MYLGFWSAPSSDDIKHSEDDWIDGKTNANRTKGDNNKTAIMTDESNVNKDRALIQGSYDISKIVWKDTNNAQMIWHDVNAEKKQKETGIKLEIYMDTLANTAIFAISTYIILKSSRRRGHKQQFHLNIPPEWINTITTKVSKKRPTVSDSAMSKDYALRFSLTQGPEFVGPQDCCHTDSTRLALFQSLSTVTEFTCHLAGSNNVLHDRKVFMRLATKFSLEKTKDRPRKDKQYAATLYAAKEGMVVSVDEGLRRVEASPPPYPSTVPRSPLRSPPLHSPLRSPLRSSLLHPKKRRLTSNEHQRPNPENESPTEKRQRPAIDDNTSYMLETLMTGIHASFNGFKEYFETRFNTLEDRLETRFENLRNQLETRFNTQETLDAGYSPCRYDSEERDAILQTVDDKCDEYIQDLNWTSSEAINDMERERRKAVDAIGEEHREAKADLREVKAEVIDMKTRMIEAFKDVSTALEKL